MRSPEMAMSVTVTPPATMSRRPTFLMTRSAGATPLPWSMARARNALSIMTLCPRLVSQNDRLRGGAASLVVAEGDERGVAADGGSVDRDRLLQNEAAEI